MLGYIFLLAEPKKSLNYFGKSVEFLFCKCKANREKFPKTHTPP
jgi:hypothetical protein